jgi:hypothetical protein
LLEQEIADGKRPPADIDKVNEARKCADKMEAWRAAFMRGKEEALKDRAPDGPSGKIMA